MSYKEIYKKTFEEMMEKNIKNKIREEEEGNKEMLNKIHEYALNNMSLTVEKILADLSISMSQYNRLKKIGLSIPAVRKMRKGKAIELTSEKKIKLAQAREIRMNKIIQPKESQTVA